MSKRQKFKGVVTREERTQGIGIVIPFDVREAFGPGNAIPVQATVNRHSYRSSLIPIRGKRYFLFINREMQDKIGVQVGDEVKVVLEHDTRPRVLDAPADLAAALEKSRAALNRWEKTSYFRRQEHVEFVDRAEDERARKRRIERLVDLLALEFEEGKRRT